ncbi:T9SS type A sorting domain-containing protein [Pontibacter sp. KCTC 32443]|uniref:PA14 domain-containing protein n=1 Tax=Pontibacter TaxID=323449 RepID=UPI00164D834E|nr:MULTISPECIES: PA14 domain-containing protein [Pontibacter]MBC5772972.1 T9SS type A sorting domain-containing protein [Pontibacter sp. KCTC 32443]
MSVFSSNSVLAQTYSGPFVITKGGTYTGNWESRDSEVPAVEIKTSEPVTIVNSNIRSAGYLIKSWGYNVNVTVRHTNGYGLTPTPWRDYKKGRRFLTADVFKNVVVENCYMEHTGGIAIGVQYVGNGSESETIKVRYNKVKNIDGRIYGGQEMVNFVGMNFRGSVPHAEIAWNQVINEPNNSAVEDNINLSNSRGTSSSPIRIHNNYIQGAYPYPATNTHYSGGGIIADSWYNDGMGDAASVATAYVKIYDNQTVNLGNYNYAVAGGNNIEVYNNRAINSAQYPDGSYMPYWTQGMYGHDYYNKGATFNSTMHHNTIGITGQNGGWNNEELYFPDGTVSQYSNSFITGSITKSHETTEYNTWLQKLSRNGIVLGPNGSAGSTTTTTNQAPTVTLTTPTANASFDLGKAISLTADAKDADGKVTKVEFFQGSTKIGESTIAPYTVSWANAVVGKYNITAKATDDRGAVTTSTAVTINVISTTASITTSPETSTSTTVGTGKITREFWSNVTAESVAGIPVNNTPTSKSELTLFESPANVGNSYGQRIRGYVTAPVTGNYTFWISSDDLAELYLSTSEDPAKKVKIAAVTAWTGSREWTKYSNQKSVSIALTAGKRYYIEALHLEGAGDDHVAIGWTLPNGTQERPIPGKYLSPMGSTAPTTTTTPIATSPTPETSTSTTVGTGKITRELWTNVQGSSISVIPVNNTPSSKTELTLFEAPSNIGDSYGQRIRGYVTAPVTGNYTFWIASDDLSELYLSTSEDPARKVKIASVAGYTGSREWTKFSTQKSVSIALTAGKRYYIEALHLEMGGGDNLAIGWTLPNGTLERPISGKYLSPMGSTSTTIVTEPIATEPVMTTPTGKITREFWSNVTAESVAGIPVNNTPTSKSELTLFESPANVGNSYGQRIRGYVTAPVTGNYTFWISSDDLAELYLSTSEDPAKKVKIAAVTAWTGSREWTKYSNQKSVSIALTAGKRYYIEALHLEGAGDDHVAIGWTLPNGTQERPIPGKYLSPMGSTVSLAGVTTTSQSTTVTTAEEDDTEIVFESATAYPNPFQEMITLDFGNQQNVKLQKVVLVNQLGKVVYEQKSLELINNKLQLNLSGTRLKKGLYILKYTDGQGISHNLNLMKQ